MAVSVENRLRWKSILISREVKWIFKAVPTSLRERMQERLWRWLFISEDGQIHRAGEVLLADLRDFSSYGRVVVDSDPILMARREGRRDVFARIINYLGVDETVVHAMMELDDGLGE